MTMNRRGRGGRRARAGFSLLEITLVLVIIGLLMAVAAVNLLGSAERASIKTTKLSMTTIQNSIKDYMLNHAGSAPASLDVLVAEKYLEPDGLEDAWGQKFYYSVQAGNTEQPYQLISNGPDKTPATDDDIDIWTMNVKE